MVDTVGIDELRDKVEAALREGGGTHSYDDVLAGIRSDRYQWWPGLKSFVVTEIMDYPQKRVCHVFLAGGELEEIRAIRTWIEQWAKQIGCTSATIYGRPGWERELKGEGWQRTAVCLEKSLEGPNG
jgi:hypothetical protein